MIFVSTGTQIYQFNRLIEELDRLVDENNIKEKVFAQIGNTIYLPQNYEYKRFLSKEEFDKYQQKASLIISHGGTGTLISASKKGKNIIAVPRLAKYGEHTDDHQLQIVNLLEEKGYVRTVYDIKNLGNTINEALQLPITKKYNRESNILNILTDYIENIL